ncbi:hypothetical protein [Sulfuricurvum sp.]|uniref:hypothetical protein n=1 Tax=Sulfuricurvum sp. TaxID=2025608 RepID=UPI00356734C7
MTLEYAGPKPLISAHGIEFDHNKEDKFVYLSIAAELIQALDHEYIEDKSYTCLTGDKPITPEIIFALIRRYDPQLDREIEERQTLVEAEIASQIKHAHENRLLCEEERQVLINNIELLRAYRIQRSINKTVYYSAIETLARIIHKGHIEHITAPMYPKFFHVFHSVQGALTKLHPPVDSTIDIYTEDKHLSVQLKIRV